VADDRHDDLGPDVRPEEIAALVDGRLPAARAAEIETLAAASPGLADAIATQRRGVEALRAAASEAAADGAPAALRARLEASRRPAPRGQRRAGWLAAAAVAAAAVLLAIFLLPSGSGGPTVAQAAELAALPAPPPAPPVDPAAPTLLDAAVDGVAFPEWEEEFGWRAAGQRADDLDGRDTRTVGYEKQGKSVAYTIVPGDALENPEDAREVTRDGVELRVFDSGDRLAVTWLRDEHTCVLSGVGVDEDTLTKLAVWKGGGAVTF
jgi:hypothetical protein